MPFLIVLIFWLAILFIGFGFFAPPNVTVVAALCVCAFSVAAAIFMVVEMDEAFVGVMRISSEPLRNALALIR
jgi:nitric oxide reductase large subunit